MNPSAAADFNSQGRDPQTSLWDEGDQHQTKIDAILGIVFGRPMLRRLSIGSLWQDHLLNAGPKISQTDDLKTFPPAIKLHYELVNDADPSDYVEMALATAMRSEFEELQLEDVYVLMEDAKNAGRFEFDDLRSGKLKEDFERKYWSRNITIELAAAALGVHKIIDVRTVRDTNKLANAIELDAAKVLRGTPPSLLNVGKEEQAIIYCSDESISRNLQRKLTNYKKLKVLRGGYDAWVAGGRPTVPRP